MVVLEIKNLIWLPKRNPLHNRKQRISLENLTLSRILARCRHAPAISAANTRESWKACTAACGRKVLAPQKAWFPTTSSTPLRNGKVPSVTVLTHSTGWMPRLASLYNRRTHAGGIGGTGGALWCSFATYCNDGVDAGGSSCWQVQRYP